MNQNIPPHGYLSSASKLDYGKGSENRKSETNRNVSSFDPFSLSCQMEISSIYSFEQQQSVIEKYLLWTHIIPLLTLPIYIEGAYCLYACKLQKHYVAVLTFHVALSFVGELYGFVLMRPVVILPIVGLYTDGVLARFHVHTFVQVILLFLLYQINACTMIHLLLFRLKNVIPLTYRYYNQTAKLGYLFVVGTYSASIISLSDFLLLYENQENAKTFWTGVLKGHVPDNFWTENYIVTSGEKFRFDMFLKLCALSLSVYTATCILLPAVAFQILNRVKHRMSARVVEAHKHYLKSLLIQVFIISSFLLLPFAFFIIGLKARIHSPILVSVSMALAISHGAAATLAMIFANQPYRSILFSHLEYVYSTAICSARDRKLKNVSIVVPSVVF